MKNKRWPTVLLVLFLIICSVTLVGAGVIYVYVRNLPPSTAVDGAGYYVRGSKVYYLGGFPSEPFEIVGADPTSFKIIDTIYGMDAARVYRDGIPITDADPQSFEIFGDNNFSKDANHVFLDTEIFSDDPAHFEFLDGSLKRDSKHIYWDVDIVSDDPANLVVIPADDYVYFKDSSTVFIQGNPIPGADLESFSIISGAYAHDKKNIYYFGKPLQDANPASFEVIQSPYGHDAQHVFWMEKVIQGADPATFKILNLNFQCTVDKTHAYYENILIPNADPATFPANSITTNCDGNGIYFSQ